MTKTEVKDLVHELNNSENKVSLDAIVKSVLTKNDLHDVAEAYVKTWSLTPKKSAELEDLKTKEQLEDKLDKLNRYELALTVNALA